MYNFKKIIILILFLLFNCIVLRFIFGATKDIYIERIVVSPDLKQIAMVILNKQKQVSELGIFEIHNNVYRPIYKIKKGSISYISWSPDGEKICLEEAVRKGRNVRMNISLINLKTKRKEVLVNNEDLNIFPVFSPHKNVIAFISCSHSSSNHITRYIWLIDLDRKIMKPLTAPHNVGYYGAWCWVPSGDNIIYSPADDRSSIWQIDISNGEKFFVIKTSQVFFDSFSMSKKGLLFCEIGKRRIFPVEKWEELTAEYWLITLDGKFRKKIFEGLYRCGSMWESKDITQNQI